MLVYMGDYTDEGKLDEESKGGGGGTRIVENKIWLGFS